MTVVSDSSPLIALARIGQLDLLAALFGTITIPVEVYEEVAVAGRGLPGADELRRADWIHASQLRPPSNPTLDQACSGLGAGESGAIRLASAVSADLILLDESRARRVARTAGLQVAGCTAILEAGARTGKVADLRAAYVELLRQGIRFDLKLLNGSLGRRGLPEL